MINLEDLIYCRKATSSLFSYLFFFHIKFFIDYLMPKLDDMKIDMKK